MFLLPTAATSLLAPLLFALFFPGMQASGATKAPQVLDLPPNIFSSCSHLCTMSVWSSAFGLCQRRLPQTGRSWPPGLDCFQSLDLYFSSLDIYPVYNWTFVWPSHWKRHEDRAHVSLIKHDSPRSIVACLGHCSISVKRKNDHSKSYKRKHLIGSGLQF